MKTWLTFCLLIQSICGQGIIFPGSEQTQDTSESQIANTDDDSSNQETRNNPEPFQQASLAECIATSGPSEGLPCIFPFRFNGKQFEGCTTVGDGEGKHWCSTQVNENGEHVVGIEAWGHCDSQVCPLADDGDKKHEPLTNDEEDVDDETPDELEEEPKQELEVFRDCVTTQGKPGQCKPSTLCIGLSDKEEDENSCELEAGNSDDLGVCCSELQRNTGQANLASKTDIDDLGISVETVSVEEVNDLIGSRFLADSIPPAASPVQPAEEFDAPPHDEDETVKEEEEEEEDILADGDPVQFHLRFNAPSDEAIQVNDRAKGLQETTFEIQSEQELSNAEAGIGLRMFNANSSPKIKSICPWIPGPSCDKNAKYRTIDGTCNNLKESNYGRAITPYQRILLPEYSAGSIHLPRTSNEDKALPSARSISLTMTQTPNVLDNVHTVLVMQMGQFVDHDITHTPNHGKVCCGQNGRMPDNDGDSEKCFPIEIPQRDTFWQGRKRCMSFARSLASPGLQCSLEFRQQMNQITHWLDGSNIYGSDKRTAQRLRSGINGQLRITRQRGSRSGTLPTCSGGTRSSKATMCRGCPSCYFAGDVRANEQLNLLVMHTVWMREHNRVASFLSKLNRHWDDEKVYQEARRVVIAEYQHIIYKEWLPVVLGNQFLTEFGLLPLSKGYSTQYREDFDPRITNEFATAAFRFGHSLIPSTFERIRKTASGRGFSTNLNLREIFFKPSQMRKQSEMLDDLVRGMISQEGEIWDNAFVKDITDHLFESGSKKGGLDLVALNIQRGRDHGLPGYNSYREICGTGSGRAKSWADFEDVISRFHVNKLKRIYDHIDDVDLFVGGFLEDAHRDSILGPTFKCIVGDQFARLKLGDRFFYDLNVSPTSAFTERQLQEIRKTSMARILCDNTDSVFRIQPQAFKMPGSSKSNKLQSCRSINIPSISLGVFREKRIRQGK